jgi:hypothetical protein
MYVCCCYPSFFVILFSVFILSSFSSLEGPMWEPEVARNEAEKREMAQRLAESERGFQHAFRAGGWSKGGWSTSSDEIYVPPAEQRTDATVGLEREATVGLEREATVESEREATVGLESEATVGLEREATVGLERETNEAAHSPNRSPIPVLDQLPCEPVADGSSSRGDKNTSEKVDEKGDEACANVSGDEARAEASGDDACAEASGDDVCAAASSSSAPEGKSDPLTEAEQLRRQLAIERMQFEEEKRRWEGEHIRGEATDAAQAKAADQGQARELTREELREVQRKKVRELQQDDQRAKERELAKQRAHEREAERERERLRHIEVAAEQVAAALRQHQEENKAHPPLRLKHKAESLSPRHAYQAPHRDAQQPYRKHNGPRIDGWGTKPVNERKEWEAREAEKERLRVIAHARAKLGDNPQWGAEPVIVGDAWGEAQGRANGPEKGRANGPGKAEEQTHGPPQRSQENQRRAPQEARQGREQQERFGREQELKQGREQQERFGREQQERFGREQQERFGREQELKQGLEQLERVGREQQERFGREQQERFGREQQERFGREQQERFGREQELKQGREQQERFGREQQERFGREQELKQHRLNPQPFAHSNQELQPRRVNQLPVRESVVHPDRAQQRVRPVDAWDAREQERVAPRSQDRPVWGAEEANANAFLDNSKATAWAMSEKEQRQALERHRRWHEDVCGDKMAARGEVLIEDRGLGASGDLRRVQRPTRQPQRRYSSSDSSSDADQPYAHPRSNYRAESFGQAKRPVKAQGYEGAHYDTNQPRYQASNGDNGMQMYGVNPRDTGYGNGNHANANMQRPGRQSRPRYENVSDSDERWG